MNISVNLNHHTKKLSEDFYELMRGQLEVLNGGIDTPEKLYQLSPDGVMFYICSKYGVDPYYIKAKGAADEKTTFARLKIIDMLSGLFDWKLEKIGGHVNRSSGYVFTALQKIRELKTKGAWPSDD